MPACWTCMISLHVCCCLSATGGPPVRQSNPVSSQAEIHPDCVGDILDREEAAPSVGWNSPGSERLPMPSGPGGGDRLCPALCPFAAPVHSAHLPCGVSQASAKLARTRGHCLSLPGFCLLPANEWKSRLCSEDGLCKRVTGLVVRA